MKCKLGKGCLVAVAVVFSALAGDGMAATGGNFILGQSNSAGNTTTLNSGTTSGPTLQLTNTGGKQAAKFTVNSGVAPFSVSNGVRIASLNADLLDGVDSNKLWKLGGNTGTSPGTNFIGTTDSEALELKVNGKRALRLEPNATSPNLVGGSAGNVVTSGIYGAVIGGGGESGIPNSVTSVFGTVGGGIENTAGYEATVGGGIGNTASGPYSTIPGGNGNTASARSSFAAGTYAIADDPGSFVWSDGNWSGGQVYSPAQNSFSAHATGGFSFWTNESGPTTGCFIDAGGGSIYCSSSRRVKKDFASVDRAQLLRRLDRIPVTTWSYKQEKAGIRHIGPMAQDFHAAFGVGKDDTSIAMVDADGVSLAAVQGLYRENKALWARLARLERIVVRLARSEPKGERR
jgi:Chaperone of endosialidase